MVEQDLVELRSRHLIRVVGLGAIRIFKVKLVTFFRARAEHFAAELFHEPGAEKLLVQAESGERPHAERQKRLANVKTRELFPLKDNDAPPRAREQRSRRASGRTAADDRDIVHVDLHCFMRLAKMYTRAKDRRRGSAGTRASCPRFVTSCSEHL